MRKGYIIFASQREYVLDGSELSTCGAVGAETGKYFQEIFGDMFVIGRKVVKNGRDVGKTTPVQFERYHLVSSRLRSKFFLFDFLTSIWTLWPIIKNSKGAIVRCGGLGTLVAIICLIQRKPYGLEIGGCVFNSLWNYGGFMGKAIAPASYLLRRFLIRHANRVQFVTQKYLQKRYLDSTSKCKNIGISNVYIENVSSVELQAQQYRQNNVIISTIGSFSGNFKGHDLAVQFIAKLASNGIDAQLRILGAGDNSHIKTFAKKLGVSNKVHVYSAVRPEEVKNWLSNSTVYIQFSRREGISRATLEAMSCAIPVLGSDVGGTSEIVSEKYLYDVGDLDDLEIKLQELLSDEKNYEKACNQSANEASKFLRERLENIRSNFWIGFPNDEGVLN